MEPTDEPLQAAESADTTASQSAVPVPPTPPATEPVIEPEADSVTDPVMEAEPAPASPAESAAAPPTVETTPEPVITSTVTIPAQETSTDEGGEWDLLVEKIKAWIDSNQLGSLWDQAQLPLRLIGGLILFVIVSTVYSGILGTINKVPLAPGLLELTGVIWLLNYARCNLVRSSDRKRVIDALGSTWNKVVGR
ncbi:CAAD domain-containing protein [bacterium]|nr:CAAD domain-containing protein [bacterium]